MKPKPPEPTPTGFTRLELLIAIGVVAVGLAITIASLSRGKSPATSIRCVNNQKQIATGFRLFANDHDGKFPIEVFTASSSHPEDVWRFFQAASEEFGSPRLLVCPADPERIAAKDFHRADDQTTNSFSHPNHRLRALSFFLGIDAKEDSPSHWLAGDRTLTANPNRSDPRPGARLLDGEVVLGGKADPSANRHLRWGRSLFDHDRRGNIGFADGHVERLTSSQLRSNVANSSFGSQRLWLPNLPETLSPSR